jgi:hypothetical protein
MASGLTGTKGGSGVWQRIISEMPLHRVYIEPFWGRGTIARLKRPAGITIGIDLDPAAVSRGRGLGALMFLADGLQWLADYFAGPAAPDRDAAGRVAGSNGFGRAHIDRPTPEDAAAAGAARNSVSVRAATFGGVPWPEHFVYLDPPYLGCRDHYRFELTFEQHRELCRLFRGLPCPAALSGYHSGLYAAELSDVRSTEIPTVNRAGQRVTEVLWMNYPPPARYHDVRFVGSDRRVRERIRRRVKNWRCGLSRMTPQERQAVYEACEGEFRVAALPTEN